MQTLKIEIEDGVYQNIVQNGIDVQAKVKEFLFDLVDDHYPEITTDEAKKRVADAVGKYKNGTGIYLNDEEYESRINNYMLSLKAKYADN